MVVCFLGEYSGTAAGFRWQAYVARGPVSYGLNPDTLYKGRGQIVRLCLYAPVGETGVWRKVASYHRGWLFGRSRYLPAVRAVVDRLARNGA